MNKYARIFVIGFAPSVGRDGEELGAVTGGFDWVRSWKEVRKFMNNTEADRHDFRIATIEVPAKLNDEGITSWLDERRDLWEPPTPEYDEEEEVAEAGPLAKEAALAEILASISEHRAANLDGANMEGINLFRTNLRNAKMRGASLRGAQLLGADMFGADMSDADLTGANLGEATLAHANLSRADLTGANFFHVNLLDARMDGAVLESTDLTGVRLQETSMTGVDTDHLLKALGIKR